MLKDASILFIIFHFASLQDYPCPKSNGSLYRLGSYRFYVIQNKTRGGFVTKDEAKAQCGLYGLEIAKIQDMLDMTQASRELVKLAFREQWQDTWYWLGATFNDEFKVYHWDDSRLPVGYHNFFYRPPRPIGAGKHVSYKGEYAEKSNFTQCLTLALPWPWPNLKTKMIFGNQASFDEKYCGSQTSRHAMCESLQYTCAPKLEPRFVYQREVTKYFESGSWIFGDRKYYVNWGHVELNQSREFCQNRGLQLFTPGRDEKYLIPHLKMWSRSITQSQFWTDLTYDSVKKQFIDQKGKVVANQTFRVNWTNPDTFIHGKSGEKSERYWCVALSLSYEFKGQIPCTDVSNVACSWSFIHYVPASCELNLASICQHKNHATRKITWENIDPYNLTKTIHQNSVTSEYGFKGNTQIIRSKVKQQMGSCYCPKGYRMFTKLDLESYDLTYVPEDMPTDDTYYFDLYETYWLEYGRLDLMPETACDVSKYDRENQIRIISTSACNMWEHYLCIRHKRPLLKPQEEEIFTKVTMEWREGPQPRAYPHYLYAANFDPGWPGDLRHLYPYYYVQDYHKVVPGTKIYLVASIMENVTAVQLSLEQNEEDYNWALLNFHIDFDSNVTLSAIINGTSSFEQNNGTFPFRRGYTFEMEIVCEHDRFQIFVDNKYYNTYVYRLPLNSTRFFKYFGGITVEFVVFNHLVYTNE